uniref:clp protease proteolytic subunit n=1 Tax=Dactylicapnos grandifoliolata TaxID=1549782 RepID=UPI0030FF2BC6
MLRFSFNFMPVGVPKVAFLIPDDEEATWVDLNRLHLERALFLGAKLDWELANTILSLMVYLTRADKTWEQFLFINCPGGWVVCGLAIFDMIRGVPPYVHTISIGRAYSMGSLVLSAGEFSERLAFPHRVLLHQPLSSYLEGSMLTPDTDEVLSLRETVIRLYSQRTGQFSWVVAFDLERDEFLTPTEAKIHGIVDAVGVDLGGLRLGQRRRQKEMEERETEERETEERETEERETEEREPEESEMEERETEERETEEREPEEMEMEEREMEEREMEEMEMEEMEMEEMEMEEMEMEEREMEERENMFLEVFPFELLKPFEYPKELELTRIC